MRIGVVGCGVAGMTAAIALARLGHDVQILERFAEPRPLGAGLLLQPTGLAALESLGLAEAVRAQGAAVDALDGRTPKGRAVVSLRYKDAHGLGIHRAALFETLYAAVLAERVEIITDFESEEVLDVGGAPRVRAADGAVEGPYDLLLIADGAASSLRRRVLPKARAPVYPWGAFWTIRPDPDGRWDGALRQIYDGCRVMVGVLPVGRVPGAADPDGRHVAVFWSEKAAGLPSVRAEGAAALIARIERRWPEAATLFTDVEDMDDIYDAVYRDVRSFPWIAGRAVLIGDAAHGTSPQLGQGANLAVIDALTLAHLLGDAQRSVDIDETLKAYRAARRAHVGYYQFMSRALTPVFQSDSRILGALRDALMGVMSAAPGTGHLMNATLTGRARWGLFRTWRGPWEG